MEGASVISTSAMVFLVLLEGERLEDDGIERGNKRGLRLRVKVEKFQRNKETDG